MKVKFIIQGSGIQSQTDSAAEAFFNPDYNKPGNKIIMDIKGVIVEAENVEFEETKIILH